MTAPQLLDRARHIDADIQVLDRRILLAQVNKAPQRTVVALVAQRNALTREWADCWQTRKVEP